MSLPDTLVDFGSTETWTRLGTFAAAALRRRWIRIAAAALIFLAAGAAAAMLLPRTYSAGSRLLVKNNYVMPALAHPTRAVPVGAESLTQSAAELVLSRSSMKNLVARYGLLERWDRERPAVLALKDRVVELVKGPLSPEDKADAIVEVLEKRIRVTVEGEVVRVHATWTSPRTVVDIANGAVEEFLAARQRIDIQTIADTSEILARAAAEERVRLEAQLAVVAAARAQAARLGTSRMPSTRRARETQPDDGLDALRGRIADARGAREEMEQRRADEIRKVEARIAETRMFLTEQHPDVRALRQALAEARVEPPSLVDARGREAALRAEYAARGGDPARAERVATATGSVEAAGLDGIGLADPDAALIAPPPASAAEVEDDALEYQRSLLKSVILSYQELLDRLANAQVELKTAQAAFHYRYTVTEPTRVPKKPDSPNVAMLVIGALVAGLAAGVFIALFAELRAQALMSPAGLRRLLTAEVL